MEMNLGTWQNILYRQCRNEVPAKTVFNTNSVALVRKRITQKRAGSAENRRWILKGSLFIGRSSEDVLKV
jgi:hypothetical protein